MMDVPDGKWTGYQRQAARPRAPQAAREGRITSFLRTLGKAALPGLAAGALTSLGIPGAGVLASLATQAVLGRGTAAGATAAPAPAPDTDTIPTTDEQPVFADGPIGNDYVDIGDYHDIPDAPYMPPPTQPPPEPETYQHMPQDPQEFYAAPGGSEQPWYTRYVFPAGMAALLSLGRRGSGMVEIQRRRYKTKIPDQRDRQRTGNKRRRIRSHISASLPRRMGHTALIRRVRPPQPIHTLTLGPTGRLEAHIAMPSESRRWRWPQQQHYHQQQRARPMPGIGLPPLHATPDMPVIVPTPSVPVPPVAPSPSPSPAPSIIEIPDPPTPAPSITPATPGIDDEDEDEYESADSGESDITVIRSPAPPPAPPLLPLPAPQSMGTTLLSMIGLKPKEPEVKRPSLQAQIAESIKQGVKLRPASRRPMEQMQIKLQGMDGILNELKQGPKLRKTPIIERSPRKPQNAHEGLMAELREGTTLRRARPRAPAPTTLHSELSRMIKVRRPQIQDSGTEDSDSDFEEGRSIVRNIVNAL